MSPTVNTAIFCGVVVAAVSATASAGYHPWTHRPNGPGNIDLSYEGRESGDYIGHPAPSRDFADLDYWRQFDSAINAKAAEVDPNRPGSMPDGWVQRGDVVMPEEVASGLKQVDPEPDYAWLDIPGNKYPRKHTVYLNFLGGMMLTGADNSAENRSTLGLHAEYPTCGCGNQQALAVVQGFQQDVAPYGIVVKYEERPSALVPYTMVMMGGNACANTNIDMCNGVGGVAPGADCEARGQRHVDYSFALSASVASQEAGHSWGLDHTTNCGSVMSYCGGGSKSFSASCDTLCEAGCQGPNSAGCRLTHEMYCGEGANRQNEDAELTFIFGGNEPDTVPPTVEILQPADGEEFGVGSDVVLKADVDDDYGGVGWRIVIAHDGETVYDEIDYYKDNIDEESRVALNLLNLEAGTYEIAVQAQDHFDHVTTDMIAIHVGEGGGDSGSGDGDSGDGDSGDGSGDGTSGDSTGSAGGDGGESTDDGCSCRSGGSGGWALLMPMLIAFARRRQLR